MSDTEKHTWNLSEQIFPSFWELKNAEQDAIKILFWDVKSFNDSYATNPNYLINFVSEAQRELKILENYLNQVQGDTALKRWFKKATKNSVYIMISNYMDNVTEELLRYKKRLSFIIKLILSTSEYQKQLKRTAN
ncbi:hypothetical protein KAW80_03250 [Candidatus Babeliales bacterium]|nr:hypothetical protein [Candidatus Babeliales bacterium]